MKHALPLALLCAATLTSQGASAASEASFRFDTTANLYEICALTEEMPGFAMANQACRAFIEATVQYHDEISARRKLKRLVCYPKGATIEDGKQAFVAWADRKSEDATLMAEQPVVGLMRALAAKYPCGRQ
ncbi:Rap1a/Tai family immunity protein [Allochromatium palmeri]|nr:Rap1a/Tai family immunity protein [Allochromatium palmeri]